MLTTATLGSLVLEGSSLVQSGSNYSANGPVEIGFAPISQSDLYTPISLWNGVMNFAANGNSFTFSGTISGIAESSDIAIAQIATTETFSIAALSSSPGVSVAGGISIPVVGATLNPTSLALIDPSLQTNAGSYVNLGGSLGFSELAGLSVPVSGLNGVQISPSAGAAGLTLSSASTITPFAAFGIDYSIGASAPISVGYSSSSSDFQISGSIGGTLTDFTFSGSLGTPSSPGLVINDSGVVTELSVSLSSDISTYGMNIDADGLTLDYDANVPNQYVIAAGGSISASDTSGDFSFQGLFGNASQSGVVIDNGNLTSLDMTVSSNVHLKDMTLTMDDLDFSYSNTLNGEFVAQSGTVTASTSAADTSLSVALGSSISPGLVIDNGELSSFYSTVNSTISAQGLTLTASGLVFQYEGGSNSFEINGGSVSIASGSVVFANATFGSPGLTILNGDLTELAITINSNLTVDGMSLSITSLEFSYDAVSNQTFGNFEIGAGGSVSLSTGPNDNTLSFSGLFGSTANDTPGLVISDGVLQSFCIGINTNIRLGSALTLTTSNLTFTYVSASQTFQIPNGSVSVADSAGDFSFTGTFGGSLAGGSNASGLVVTNGVLTELEISVTSQISAASSLTLTVSDLDFYYNASGNQYEIDSGSLSFHTSEDYTFTATFGLPNPSNSSETLPGLVISNGVMTEFNASLTSSFTVAGLAIGVNDMAMSYASAQYEMYGTVSVDTSDIQFTGTIGTPTASPPGYGLIINNNVLESLAIAITSTVTLGDLSVAAQPLAFNYEASPESFTLYGNVTASIAGVTLVGNLGTQSSPGLMIVNGQLTEFNLGVSANFSLFDLQCNIQDLTFQYEALNGNTDYILYGSLAIAVSGNTMSATMGNDSNPGLIIENGVVEQINMSISDSFQIAGFTFDIDDAGVYYTASNDEYQIYGTFTLADVFSASVQLGTGSTNPGITIIGGVFVLDEFSFSLDNVAMGAFTLNYVNISYDSTDDVWSGSGSVTFPTGWSISASMTFVEGILDDISLAYSAGTSPGIEIPDTGMFVTSISASLQNLDEPANIIVSGSIDAVFGKEIDIGGTTCAIFAATGSFTADSQELILSGGYYEGAYESNGHWTGILGQGTASVDLDWGAGVYTASLSESLYDGIFTVSAEMAFDDSGDLGIIATASVNVPNGVPFIGGTSLGSMSFAFIYTASDDTGTVAAWASVNCYFFTVTTGFEYTFNGSSSGDFSLIGAGGVNNIENSFNSISSADTSTPPTYVYNYTVTIPSASGAVNGDGANGVSVQASWPTNSGTQTLLISGPDDNGTYYSVTSSNLPADDQFLTSYTTSTSQSVMTNGSSTSVSVLLPSGTYSFEVQSSYEFASTSDVTFTNQLYYEPPSVAITSTPASALAFVPTMTGFAASALAADTTITLYAGTSNSGYMGKEVGSFGYAVGSNGDLENVPSINLSSYSPGVPIYIYAVIDDGTNTAVDSAYSAAIIPVPNLVGQVLDQFGNPISGMRVFLDLNNDQNYDAAVYSATGAVTTPGDPSAITNASGDYYFNDLENYQTSDNSYPTFRVMALMPSPSFTPINPSDDVDTISLSSIAPTPGNATPSLQANFTINRLASISGSLYSDLVQNGVYVASDPSLAGATVYLDMSGSGTYESNDPTCVTGPTGTYGFYNLTAPSSYTTGIITSTTTNGITQNNYVVTQPTSQTYSVPVTSDAQQLSGYTFGVISLATISGTITSQNSGGSTPTSLAGATVDISTPTANIPDPDFGNFHSTSGLNLVGSSVSSINSLTMLSSTQSNTATAAWYTSALPSSGGFESSFQWSMTSSGASAGGFAFVIQNDGTSAVGSTAFGYGGLEKSLAIVFDAVDNEVLIESGGNTSSPIAVLTSEQLGFTLANGTLYTARITDLPSNSAGLGNLNVYLSGDGSSGLTPVLSGSVNLSSLLGLASSSGAIFGFTAGTSGTGLAASVASWTLTALTTQSTTTNSQGNYTFTGLMPKLNYTVSQVIPGNYVQATPSNTLGVYSQSSLGTPAAVASSVTTGDFNGDGIPDIAYATSLDGGSAFQITYALGNGKGGFGTATTVNLPLTATAPKLATSSNGSKAFDAFLAAGDFGETSRDDIAYVATMAKGGEAIVIYDVLAQKVVDQIEVESSTVAPTGASNVTAGNASTINNLAVGDLNNDGYDDLAVSTYGGVFTITSLQDLSAGTTWTVNPSTLATPLLKPSLNSSSAISYNGGVALADFNQDGNLDLVTVGAQYVPMVTKSDGEDIDSWTNMTVDTSLQIAYGTGNGVSYNPQAQISFQSYSSSNIDAYFSTDSAAPLFPIPFGMAASDVSGDGIPDIELNGYTSTLQPAVFLLTQTSPGTFTGTNTITIPNGKSFNINSSPGANNTSIPGSTILPAQVLSADLNGDGFNDVAAVDPNFGQLLLLTSQVAGLTSGQTQNLQELSGGALPQFVLGDYSVDGYPDLVVPGENQYPYQADPVEILNGTINVGVISYTPSNGQALLGQNFTDINFAATSEAVTDTAFAEPQASVDATMESVANAGTPTITGRVYLDGDMDSRFDNREPILGGLTVYLDLDHDGQYNPADDPSAVTNSQGYYEFTGLRPGQTYTIRIANLPSSYFFNPVNVTMPGSDAEGTVSRSLAVDEFWSLPQAGLSVDPLTQIEIDLAPLSFRDSLEIKPFFQLVGTIPDGMTIDPNTGEIFWIPSMSYANSTVTVTVKIQNAADRSEAETQWNVFEIHVSAVSTMTAFIRDIYGDLLQRLPSSQEISYWTGQMESGMSRSAFVSGVSQSDERFTILTNDMYLNVLKRYPTTAELASAMSLFHSGGNSDQLTVDLLTGSAFLQLYKSDRDYVNAVNQILTFKTASKAATNLEIAWLKAGLSRTKLVTRILRSRAATMAKSKQLSGLFLDGPSTSKTLSQWSSALSRGSLNTDTLTELILASTGFFSGVASRPVSNTSTSNSSGTQQYNRLNHLLFTMTGTNATRSQLDSLELQLYHGQTWEYVARSVYNSQAAFDFRVQTQYEDLLHRAATTSELASLALTLPAGNTTEALRIQLLASTEYRSRFDSSTDYASEVFQVLTGTAASPAVIQSWVRQLRTGLPALQFVQTVASSQAGKVDQITRLYAELLQRIPTLTELTFWLDQDHGSNPRDRTIALNLANSSEFRQTQRKAALLPGG